MRHLSNLDLHVCKNCSRVVTTLTNNNVFVLNSQADNLEGIIIRHTRKARKMKSTGIRVGSFELMTVTDGAY